MRIGEFAEKHTITQDTIRHYLDLGLLMTSKKGGQFKFSEEDDHVIEKVKMLKDFHFSLAEIQEIFAYMRLEGNHSSDFRKYYLKHLRSKSKQILAEKQKLAMAHERLHNTINQVMVEEKHEAHTLGLPFQAMDLLQCPVCQKTLNISGGMIKNNMMLEGVIQCDCGYTAKIENGIFHHEPSDEIKRKNHPYTRVETYMEEASPKFINMIYKSMDVLLEQFQIHSQKPKYILEIDNCPGRLLKKRFNFLSTHSVYILFSDHLEKLQNIKTELETQPQSVQFLFICCEIEKLPIKSASIDVILDNCASLHYASKKKTFIFDIISPLLKVDGLVMGVYPQLGPSFHGCSTNAVLNLFLKKDQIFRKIENTHVTQLETFDIGPIVENNRYMTEEMKNKELFFTVYIGKKKKSIRFLAAERQKNSEQDERSEWLVSL